VTKSAPEVRASARGLRVALVRSAFNAKIVDGLVAGARAALSEMGAAPASVVELTAPGAFELPLLARAALESGGFDAVVALGAVIKGETDHYEYICDAATRGLADVALAIGAPVGFGLLTCRTEKQALARAKPGIHNKGAEAARAAVSMVNSLRSLVPPGKRR
jgi:6,7-dimethyl-8-ribityllumazine synthase